MTIVQLALRYDHATVWVVDHCPPPDKFAHTYAGLTIWLGSALLLRRPLRSTVPLAIVLIAEGLNEVLDCVAHGGWNLPDTLGDMAATWFWPLILFAVLRSRSSLW